jgi:hypothetical protein
MMGVFVEMTTAGSEVPKKTTISWLLLVIFSTFHHQDLLSKFVLHVVSSILEAGNAGRHKLQIFIPISLNSSYFYSYNFG